MASYADRCRSRAKVDRLPNPTVHLTSITATRSTLHLLGWIAKMDDSAKGDDGALRQASRLIVSRRTAFGDPMKNSVRSYPQHIHTTCNQGILGVCAKSLELGCYVKSRLVVAHIH